MNRSCTDSWSIREMTCSNQCDKLALIRLGLHLKMPKSLVRRCTVTVYSFIILLASFLHFKKLPHKSSIFRCSYRFALKPFKFVLTHWKVSRFSLDIYSEWKKKKWLANNPLPIYTEVRPHYSCPLSVNSWQYLNRAAGILERQLRWKQQFSAEENYPMNKIY